MSQFRASFAALSRRSAPTWPAVPSPWNAEARSSLDGDSASFGLAGAKAAKEECEPYDAAMIIDTSNHTDEVRRATLIASPPLQRKQIGHEIGHFIGAQ